jgi:hypothetical protein
MAQSGYTPLQLYRSATATNVPLATDLAAGELAINTADGRLFYKDSSGTVQIIAARVAAVANGGTGLTTLTANNVILGNGTSSPTFVAPGTTGNILTSNGTTWVSSPAPATGVTTISFGTTGLTPSTSSSGAVTVAGTLAVANGGTGNTTAQAEMNRVAGAVTSGQYLRGNGTNVVMSTIQAADVPTLNQNTTGSSGSCTGNSATATTLQTARNINGVSFNGSADITITAAATNVATQLLSLGVGTAASGTTGEIRATNNITAFFSDDRLKTRHGKIENALDKLHTLDGFYYTPNKTAQDLGYEAKQDVGVSAQSVQAILPEIVAPAPIDDKYLTVRYEKLVPLLIEAIKELTAKVEALENK